VTDTGSGTFRARIAMPLSESLVMARQPLGFFLKGAGALAGLLLVTLTMESRPEVYALRAMILIGFAVIALKVVLRQYNIDWPRRNREVRPSRRPE
jgi:hypothetical protein